MRVKHIFNPYPGFVYIFSVWDEKDEKTRRPTKIGFCHEKPRWGRDVVYKRLNEIQRHHWNELCIDYISKEKIAANEIENDIHIKYIDFNIRGEWFNLTDRQIKNIVKYIEGIKI
jgi:hypothetical protein